MDNYMQLAFFFTKNGGVFEVPLFLWELSSQMTSSSGISISKGILRWRTTARTKTLNAVEALMPKPSQSVSKRFFKSESKRIVYADCDIMMLFWWQKYSIFLKCDDYLQKKTLQKSSFYVIGLQKLILSSDGNWLLFSTNQQGQNRYLLALF